MICVNDGELQPLYFKDIMDPEHTKQSCRVDIKGRLYKIACNYMIRLEKDLQNKDLITKCYHS